MYLMISILALLIAFFIAIIKPEYRKLLIIVNIFICIIYIIWRFTAIPIDHDIISFILGISLYCAESQQSFPTAKALAKRHNCMAAGRSNRRRNSRRHTLLRHTSRRPTYRGRCRRYILYNSWE